MRSFSPSVALVTAAFLLGCQDIGTGPLGPDGPQFHHSFGHDKGGGKDDDGETFDFFVTVSTVGGSDWTASSQEVRKNNAKNWLHVFDSGGNGTRGNPNFDNAAFSTATFFAPPDQTGCVGDGTLFTKFDQPSRDVVFDFQVSYDIAAEPRSFHFFLFRWKESGTGKIFSASTGFGSSGSDPHTKIVFLGDGDDGTNDPDLIDDPTKTRIFRISEAKVIARELDGKKVIRMLECPNPQIFEVSVIPK